MNKKILSSFKKISTSLLIIMICISSSFLSNASNIDSDSVDNLALHIVYDENGNVISEEVIPVKEDGMTGNASGDIVSSDGAITRASQSVKSTTTSNGVTVSIWYTKVYYGGRPQFDLGSPINFVYSPMPIHIQILTRTVDCIKGEFYYNGKWASFTFYP